MAVCTYSTRGRMPRSACPLQLLVKYSGVALTDHYEASGKNALDRTGTALGYLWDFWVKNISGSPQYIKKAPRRSIVGGGGHPPGGRAFPTAWGLQQLVMENHSAIRGLKISHRGACRWAVWQSAGGARPAVPSRGQHVGRAVEEREFCPVNLDPNDCEPPLLLPIQRQTTSAWACVAPIARAEVCKTPKCHKKCWTSIFQRL
jgi:hypothetical protein